MFDNDCFLGGSIKFGKGGGAMRLSFALVFAASAEASDRPFLRGCVRPCGVDGLSGFEFQIQIVGV